MATIASQRRLCFLSLLFSFLLFCLSASTASDFHTVKLDMFFPSNAVCSETKGFNKLGETVFRIIDRHGPCSLSLRRKTPTPLQILQQDESRVAYLRSRASLRKTNLKLTSVTLPANSGRSLGTSNYVTVVGLGTPTKNYTLTFDTGSDLTWMQCKPCSVSCYPQEAPLFNPSQSSSYTNISCSAPECSSLKPATGNPSRCSSSTCVYSIQYLDESYSVGYLARETLTLTPSSVFPNFLFGCGQNNTGLFGSADGLLGLGRNKVSLVSQTTGKFAGVFSYCIPSTSSSPGYLTFGPTNASGNTNFTSLLTNRNPPSLYWLNLTGISVGGHRLTIDSSVFSTSGTVIDSGTVISHLPPAAYGALKSAFKQLISPEYPSAQRHSILDTCYNFTGYDSVMIPKITFHFKDDANLDVDGSGILYGVSISQVCLAIAGNDAGDEIAIIGNRQQRRFGVIYDEGQKRVGFTPKACN